MKIKKFVKEPLSKSKLKRLIKLVNGSEELNPKTKLETIELSLAKWHPSRGEMQGTSVHKESSTSCGCCCWFSNRYACIDINNFHCPLGSCGDPYDLYNCWEEAEKDTYRTRWANIIYYILLCTWNIEKGFIAK